MKTDLASGKLHRCNSRLTYFLQGAGLLTDEHFAGREIIAFGHSTGGPMAAHLTRFSKKAKVIGIVGFGSGGPDGWRLEWRDKTGAEKYAEKPIDHVSRRSPRFQDYDARGDDSPYAGLFLTCSSVFPQGARESDLLALYTIRPTLPQRCSRPWYGQRTL